MRSELCIAKSFTVISPKLAVWERVSIVTPLFSSEVFRGSNAYLGNCHSSNPKQYSANQIQEPQPMNLSHLEAQVKYVRRNHRGHRSSAPLADVDG